MKLTASIFTDGCPYSFELKKKKKNSKERQHFCSVLTECCFAIKRPCWHPLPRKTREKKKKEFSF